MGDAADKVVSDDERAMALFEEDLRQRRIAESMRPAVFNPVRRCVDCGEQIPLARLKALSDVGRCAPCSEAASKRYREAR